MKKSSIVLSMLAVFASGAVVGAFSHRLYTVSSVSATAGPKRRSPEDFRRWYVQELSKRLQLEEPQVQRLNTVLDSTHRRFAEIHERIKPEMTAIQQDQIRSVNEFLNPEQQKEYAKWREERDRRRRESKK